MLEGTLVNLRAHKITDAGRLHAWINDRDVTLFLGARYEQSLAYEEAWMRTRAETPPSLAGAYFAVETKAGALIGQIGLHDASPEDRSAWLGMMIGEKKFWSHGYGSDALVTLVRFAFDEMGLHRISLDVYDFNGRALSAYRKCGFVEEAGGAAPDTRAALTTMSSRCRCCALRGLRPANEKASHLPRAIAAVALSGLRRR